MERALILGNAMFVGDEEVEALVRAHTDAVPSVSIEPLGMDERVACFLSLDEVVAIQALIEAQVEAERGGD